jgi:hypothetical protein
MKKIIISAAMLIATNSFSQMTISKKIATGTGRWDITMDVKNGMDTSTYFYYSFKNQAYKYINDIGSIYLTEQEELIDFANALKTLVAKKGKVDVMIDMGNYSLNLFANIPNEINIRDNDGRYTYITKITATKMANEFLLNAKYLNK